MPDQKYSQVCDKPEHIDRVSKLCIQHCCHQLLRLGLQAEGFPQL